MISSSSSASRLCARLLRRARRGDRAAFGRLSVELKPYLRARLRACHCTHALFRNPDDVEDALHDALAVVWEKLPTFQPSRGSALGWLWTICRNCAVNILRRRRRDRTQSLYDRNGDFLPGLTSKEDPPLVRVAAAEQRRRLRRTLVRALRRAEPRIRRAWRLRMVEGLPYADVAVRLGVPTGTLATWLHRLKKQLRAATENGK
jgi:RNA polymerase sigma-70 factor (ECF subfamily)